MAYTDANLEKLSKCCEGCRLANLGTKIDTLLADIDSDTGYSGDLLTATEISYLNNICEMCNRTSFGTTLNAILTASQGYTSVSAVSDTVKNYLNSGCEAFHQCLVGTELQTAVTTINTMTEYDEALINTFYFTGFEEETYTIDDEGETITVELPALSVVTNLVANFTTSTGAVVTVSDVAQVSGTTANDFTSALDYLVTSKTEDVTKTYEVTVTVAAE